jgi:hypothetical protein
VTGAKQFSRKPGFCAQAHCSQQARGSARSWFHNESFSLPPAALQCNNRVSPVLAFATGDMLSCRENTMRFNFGDPHIQPIVALVAGILVLLMPRLLNYIVAFALIIYGLVGLNAIYKVL